MILLGGLISTRLHRVCVEWSGTSAHAVYAVFTCFCYIGVFGNLTDPVVPTLRCASRDVMTAYAYKHTEGCFLQSLALPSAGQGPNERGKPPKMTYMCAWSGTQPAPWAAQISKFAKLIFFDIVTTQNDDPSYVKHVLSQERRQVRPLTPASQERRQGRASKVRRKNRHSTFSGQKKKTRRFKIFQPKKGGESFGFRQF